MTNESVVTLDIHGMTVFKARVAIDAALRRSFGVYRIRVVHGYSRGTALRDTVRVDYADHPSVLRIQPDGEGATFLVLREL